MLTTSDFAGRTPECLPAELLGIRSNANDEDRDIDGFAGNPELEPETSWSYEGELEYRLPNDAGVLATSVFYSDIDNKIGRINATVDPDRPVSATGNVGPAKQYGWFTRASLRLNQFNLPNAIVSGRMGLFDSEILDPFIKSEGPDRRQRVC